MIDQVLRWMSDNTELTALLVTVFLAFVGYLIGHLSSLQQQRAQARLRYVSAQLERLYGPLFSLVEANTASWVAFRKVFRPNARLFDSENPFTERERNMWRAWAEHVFVPSNLKIRDVIESNAHLLVDGVMPDVFRRIIAHIESSKLVLPALSEGDLSALEGFEAWPDEFEAFVQQSFFALQREHARLIGRARIRGRSQRALAAAPRS